MSLRHSPQNCQCVPALGGSSFDRLIVVQFDSTIEDSSNNASGYSVIAWPSQHFPIQKQQQQQDSGKQQLRFFQSIRKEYSPSICLALGVSGHFPQSFAASYWFVCVLGQQPKGRWGCYRWHKEGCADFNDNDHDILQNNQICIDMSIITIQ